MLRTTNVTIRVSPAEKEILTALAARHQTSAGPLIRQWIRAVALAEARAPKGEADNEAQEN